jgi:general secretion pathway protein K
MIKTYKLHKNQDGIALMVVLWILVLLMALATEFAFSMKSEVNTTRNYKEDIQAYHWAKAGIHLAMAEILAPSSVHASHKDFGLIMEDVTKKSEAEPIKSDVTAFLHPNRKNIQYGAGLITYSIVDENRKIPINTTERITLVKVLTSTGIKSKEKKDVIADSILDWIDIDKEYRINGAENDYYQSLTPPYNPKNARIENLDELLKIRGIDEKILYGTDQHKGLINFFTPYNVKTNPNTASPEILSIIFSESQENEIMKQREKKGFYDKTISNYFTIRSTGAIDGSPTIHTIKTVVQKISKNSVDQKNFENTVDQKISEKQNPILLTHYWNDNSF